VVSGGGFVLDLGGYAVDVVRISENSIGASANKKDYGLQERCFSAARPPR
jgi:hypothetical protein